MTGQNFVFATVILESRERVFSVYIFGDGDIYLFFIIIGSTGSTISLERSALYATRSTTAVRRVESIVNVLLRVNSDQKRWRVAQLLTNSDMSLTDHNTSVMDSLGKTALENLSLKASLEHLLGSHGQSIIELSLIVVQETKSDQLSEESLTLELSGLVILIKGQQVTSSRSDLGQGIHDSPDLSLVLETVLTDESELRIETSLLEGSSWSLGGL
jgi:hypothetical protein